MSLSMQLKTMDDSFSDDMSGDMSGGISDVMIIQIRPLCGSTTSSSSTTMENL